MTDIETFDIPAFTSQGGITLDLQLAYKTYGDMSAAKDNVILVTTSYSAQHEDAEGLFAPSERLDLSDYCVVVVNMLYNGFSTSPSHTSPPLGAGAFPDTTIHDNVGCGSCSAMHLLETDLTGNDTATTANYGRHRASFLGVRLTHKHLYLMKIHRGDGIRNRTGDLLITRRIRGRHRLTRTDSLRHRNSSVEPFNRRGCEPFRVPILCLRASP